MQTREPYLKVLETGKEGESVRLSKGHIGIHGWMHDHDGRGDGFQALPRSAGQVWE